jgi:methionine synthase I (cobalamin-dependent)
MVMDGAMGTMIQSYRLEEKDFRGRMHMSSYPPSIYPAPAHSRGGVQESSKAA